MAKTPLKAAQAPLATARISHWDLRLIFCMSIFAASSGAACDEGWEGVTLEDVERRRDKDGSRGSPDVSGTEVEIPVLVLV